MVKDLTQKVINSKGKSVEILPEKTQKTPSSSAKKGKKAIHFSEIECPKCKKQGIIKGKKAYGCSHYNECNFTIPFEIFGKKLTEKQVIDLLIKGKTAIIKGLVGLPEDKNTARLLMNSDYSIDTE